MGFYRTRVINHILEHSPADYVRSPELTYTAAYASAAASSRVPRPRIAGARPRSGGAPRRGPVVGQEAEFPRNKEDARVVVAGHARQLALHVQGPGDQRPVAHAAGEGDRVFALAERLA